ncbi:MAG: T9SS type A sorting domain-containing protein [Candidatus Fermentibacteraceae bacterium]
MKVYALLLVCVSAVPAAFDTSVLVEVTADGVFYVPAPLRAVLSAPVTPTVASSLLWHYSQTEGLTQKTCPIGNSGEFVFTGGWYGGGRMFEGVSGDGTVFWQSEPELESGQYWTSLGTGTSASDTADRYWLARTFAVWNDNGTPGYTPDDFLVSDDNVEVCLFAGASSVPLWVWDGSGSFESGMVDQAGTYDCSDDGSVFALGGIKDGHLAVVVFEHGSPEPVLLFESTDYVYSPRQLRLTADGSKIIFSVGATLLRVDVATGALEGTFNLGASTDCFGVSADGSLVAFGFTAARLAQWNGSAYEQAWSRGVSGYYAGAAAVSDDNSTVYFGFYKSNYMSNRIYRFDAASSTPVWTYDYPTGSGSNQDIVSWMDCSSNGRWLAVSSWGCQSGGGPEVMVLDDQEPSAPVFTIDTPGSMFHVDISADGSLLSAAGKHVHANVFGSGTDVYMAEVTTTGVEEGGEPSSPMLSVSPNPSAGAAVFEVHIPVAAAVELSVFDIAGRRVSTVFSGVLGAGTHSFPFSLDLAGGLYLVRASADEHVAVRKIIITI